jgi:hypothetical protein
VLAFFEPPQATAFIIDFFILSMKKCRSPD